MPFPEITLYGSSKATCTQRVMMLFEELRLHYNFVSIDLMAGNQKSKGYLALNPFGKVPCVRYKETEESDEKIIFESRTILRYFANKFDKQTDMYPDVFADQFLEATSQNLTPLLSKIVYERVFKKWKNEDTDEQVVKKVLKELPDILTIFNDRLRNNKYLGGDTFTIADLEALPYLVHFVKCDPDYKKLLKEFRHVYVYYKKLMIRDSVKKILANKG